MHSQKMQDILTQLAIGINFILQTFPPIWCCVKDWQIIATLQMLHTFNNYYHHIGQFYLRVIKEGSSKDRTENYILVY